MARNSLNCTPFINGLLYVYPLTELLDFLKDKHN